MGQSNTSASLITIFPSPTNSKLVFRNRKIQIGEDHQVAKEQLPYVYKKHPYYVTEVALDTIKNPEGKNKNLSKKTQLKKVRVERWIYIKSPRLISQPPPLSNDLQEKLAEKAPAAPVPEKAQQAPLKMWDPSILDPY